MKIKSKKNKSKDTSSDEFETKDENYLKQLRDEIQEFEHEKERIRRVMGDLGGTKFTSKEFIINIILALLVLSLLILQVFFNVMESILSIELAVFLVSVKIILMIHAQQKHNHFMFWVLNTIEFRINDTYKLLKKVAKDLEKKDSGAKL